VAHLGSIAIITDGGGAVLERLAYDAWGKRRNTNGTDDPAGAITSSTTRGFTGHEHISSVGLVNMNGRVYDPELGRFLSADPIVPSIFFSQALNRFSYVYNRPLSLVDPSGYFGAAEIVITAFRINPVVGVVASFLGAIFGGLFGGHHALAAIHYFNPPPPSAPPSPVAAAGGSPSGVPLTVHEDMSCGTSTLGACTIEVIGVETSAVAANSAPAACTLASIGASVGVSPNVIKVSGQRPQEFPVPAGYGIMGTAPEIVGNYTKDPNPWSVQDVIDGALTASNAVGPANENIRVPDCIKANLDCFGNLLSRGILREQAQSACGIAEVACNSLAARAPMAPPNSSLTIDFPDGGRVYFFPGTNRSIYMSYRARST
jgi:RHS repeat-associated protein